MSQDSGSSMQVDEADSAIKAPDTNETDMTKTESVEHGMTAAAADTATNTTSNSGKDDVIASVVPKKRKGRDGLHDSIQEMMYGFGDAWPPSEDAVSVVDKLVKEYIQDLALRALTVSEIRGKLDKECFMFQVRKDHRKFYRVHRLLNANKEINNSKKVEYNDDTAE